MVKGVHLSTSIQVFKRRLDDVQASDWRLVVERMISSDIGWHTTATYLVGSRDTTVPYDYRQHTMRVCGA